MGWGASCCGGVLGIAQVCGVGDGVMGLVCGCEDDEAERAWSKFTESFPEVEGVEEEEEEEEVASLLLDAPPPPLELLMEEILGVWEPEEGRKREGMEEALEKGGRSWDCTVPTPTPPAAAPPPLLPPLCNPTLGKSGSAATAILSRTTSPSRTESMCPYSSSPTPTRVDEEARGWATGGGLEGENRGLPPPAPPLGGGLEVWG